MQGGGGGGIGIHTTDHTAGTEWEWFYVAPLHGYALDYLSSRLQSLSWVGAARAQPHGRGVEWSWRRMRVMADAAVLASSLSAIYRQSSASGNGQINGSLCS